ncbi:MAG: hypothetical protein LUF30_03415, partial [Lachnospiraceae bacterium]|nr:hypothetical protein [Lachnospiraceae bacterium]
MEHQNFERELKYLKTQEGMSLEDVLHVFYKHGYVLIETREKKKNESYYDDNELSFLKKGDVIRSSKHFNADGTYFHFMYKKNVSNPEKPYVSKYELGSGAYQTIREFILAMNIQEEILTEPFLYADMTRETAIIEKNNERLL